MHPEGQAGQPSCCCHHFFFIQPNFVSQKPLLQEHIKSCGHLCDFYPKYHCELNFIEQYWGAAKLCFRIAGWARTLVEMERKMLVCLDNILIQIQRHIVSQTDSPSISDINLHYNRFANRSMDFISTYCQGLSGAQAVWANKKYHGHHTLPPDMVALVKKTILE
jgi:hypothetical protein